METGPYRTAPHRPAQFRTSCVLLSDFGGTCVETRCRNALCDGGASTLNCRSERCMCGTVTHGNCEKIAYMYLTAGGLDKGNCLVMFGIGCCLIVVWVW